MPHDNAPGVPPRQQSQQYDPLRADRFERLAAAGFGSVLLPIIPPDAVISESSPTLFNRPAGALGKIPGKRLNDGTWIGFPDWSDIKNPGPIKRYYRSTPADLIEWASWGATVGVGAHGYMLPALDFDSDNRARVERYIAKTFEMIGTAPVRVGQPPHALLPYKILGAFGSVESLSLDYTNADTGEHFHYDRKGEGGQYLVDAH